MISCPIFSRSVSEARVFSTHRWSAAASGVIAPGLAAPRNRRADASTPGTIVGAMVARAGAQARANAAMTRVRFEDMSENTRVSTGGFFYRPGAVSYTHLRAHETRHE